MARKKNRRELPDLRSIQISPAYYAGKCVGNLLRWLFLLAIAFIILYPLLYMVSMAFRSPKDFMDITVVWLPKTPTWDNFRTAVVDVHLFIFQIEHQSQKQHTRRRIPERVLRL